MPRAPKVCRHAGCTTLTTTGTCPQHTTHRWGNGARRTTTAAHKAWSKAVRERDGRCMIQLPGCTGGADTADHIHPVAFGGDELSLANGRAACWHCHNRKSSREGHRAQGHKPRG
ncbi:HNH endonuclease [Mycobacterium phage WillSterrel]|uniref:HNH endonuclease n=3 Tax=Cheoctovirus TaxID=1623281 RepID=A0A1P8DUC4_9CAUD|nr:HNH endonuclease [Mycobacterium phage Bubbles123]YP_009962039.1 HNH endonuclease [Mycobacterium phage Royals2015]YP_009963496.1 HNH endonuclease [Mycobacterium phage WillSterrel]AYQ99623.1 HNH endonuclease [Mycobacterium phage IrishSherpFalk]OKH66259.1 hypothetical protein EB74_04700 [Mycobacterium sp. SWH-M5]AOQ28562.1 HNH endonuclease [Mycobacterium phage WillSterrel]APU93106.1 HNH endonuclease [Mycobacterium phage Bubbles123]QNO12420.1 HNH endonuclease [Mycobacterium phage Royals2015]